MERLEEVLKKYRKACLNKDVNLMLSLYSDDVFIYDAFDKWSINGKEELKSMIEDWFNSLLDESLDVEFSNIKIIEDEKIAYIHFDAKFIGINRSNEKYKSISNRFTLCLCYENMWKIVHQHASMPIVE